MRSASVVGVLASVIVAALAACSGTPREVVEMRTLRGSVTYRERMALPEGCTLAVRILPVTPGLGDAPLAESVAPIAAQVPIAFAVEYDAARMPAGAAYGVVASIRLGEEVLFASPTPVLLEGAAGRAMILARPAPPVPPPPPDADTGLELQPDDKVGLPPG